MPRPVHEAVQKHGTALSGRIALPSPEQYVMRIPLAFLGDSRDECHDCGTLAWPQQEPQGEVAVLEEALESGQWRGFRLFLVSLGEQELKRVGEQLNRELAARQDCEHNVVRLFFSSLAASDLEMARQAIGNERAARAQERRTLAALATGRKRRKPAAR